MRGRSNFKKFLGTAAVSFAGEMMLRQTGALLEHVPLIVANDSGPMHLLRLRAQLSSRFPAIPSPAIRFIAILRSGFTPGLRNMPFSSGRSLPSHVLQHVPTGVNRDPAQSRAADD